MEICKLENIKVEFNVKQTEEQVEDPDEEVIVPNDLQDFEFESNSMTESIDLTLNDYYINSKTDQQIVENKSNSKLTTGSSLLKKSPAKGRKKKKNSPTVEQVLDANDDDLSHMKLIEEILGNKPQNPVVLRLPQISAGPHKNKSAIKRRSNSLMSDELKDTIGNKIVVKKKKIPSKVKASKTPTPIDIRIHHNESERQRRGQLSKHFSLLRNQIPKLNCAKKTPRIKVLLEAKSYINRLISGQKLLERLFEEEVQKKNKLLKIVSELK